MDDFEEFVKKFNDSVTNLDPQEVINKIQVEINDFIENSVLTETPGSIFTIDRKGTYLFNPLNNRLMEEGFSISSLRFFKGLSYAKGDVRTKRDVILLVDSINNGEEVEKAISFFKDNDQKIASIYSYISNKKGLKNLADNKVATKIKIVSYKEFKDGEYAIEYKKLYPYYHSRIDPMDPDHAYNIFRSSKKIPKKELVKRIRKIMEDILGEKTIFSEDRMLLKEDVFAYTAETPKDPNSIAKKLRLIPKELKDCSNIERIQVRIKGVNEGVTNLRIMPFCSPEDFKYKIKGKKSCKEIFKNCLLDTIIYDAKAEEKTIQIFCTLCFENLLSMKLLKKINKKIIQDFKDFGMVKLREHSPADS